MLHLLKKDITIHRSSWIIYFAMLVFFMAFNKDAIFIISLMTAIVTMNAFYADEQANGHKLWNALPFTRSEIVSARYISLLVFMIISIGAFMIIGLIFKGGSELSLWKELIGCFIVMMFSSALCFPVFYWISRQNLIFVLLISYILLVVAGTYAFYYLYLHLIETSIIPQTWNDGQLFGFGSLIALCLYMLSWVLSIKIYRRRELI